MKIQERPHLGFFTPDNIFTGYIFNNLVRSIGK